MINNLYIYIMLQRNIKVHITNYGGDIHIYYLSTHNKKINKINI
jgi:hypothetical protein